MSIKNKIKTNFKNRVRQKLEREGYTVTEVSDKKCGFEFLRTDPRGEIVGIRIKPHGHIYKEEKKELLRHNMPVYVASEQYSGDSSVHMIKVVRIIGGV